MEFAVEKFVNVQRITCAVVTGVFLVYSKFLLASVDLMTDTLQKSDLQEKNCMELRFMRNEIYARHGRKFRDPELKEYYNDQPWYRPQHEPGSFPNKLLTNVQKNNIQIIIEKET